MSENSSLDTRVCNLRLHHTNIGRCASDSAGHLVTMRATRFSQTDRGKTVVLAEGRSARGAGYSSRELVRAGAWVRPGEAATLRLRLHASGYFNFSVGVAQRGVGWQGDMRSDSNRRRMWRCRGDNRSAAFLQLMWLLLHPRGRVPRRPGPPPSSLPIFGFLLQGEALRGEGGGGACGERSSTVYRQVASHPDPRILCFP